MPEKEEKKTYLVDDGVTWALNPWRCWGQIRSNLLVLILFLDEINVEIDGSGSELLPELRTHLLDTAFCSQTHVIGKLLWSNEIEIHGSVGSGNQRGPDCALRVVKVIGRVIRELAEKLEWHEWVQILHNFCSFQHKCLFFFFYLLFLWWFFQRFHCHSITVWWFAFLLCLCFSLFSNTSNKCVAWLDWVCLVNKNERKTNYEVTENQKLAVTPAM